jgi:hypothetical protein
MTGMEGSIVRQRFRARGNPARAWQVTQASMEHPHA